MRTIGGRYELRGEVASGGMATVHLARQLGAAGFARIVAVKRLHEPYARDPEFIAMFLDEARFASRFRHPNVVQTLDVVQEKGEGGGSELFIVMEYIHGESLTRLLKATRDANESVPLKIASAIMVGVLHGLHEAHEAKSESGEPLGLVHRDVSPHNVLVGIDGIARLLDFGVAKAEERMSATTKGKVKGKLAYMAPEQVDGSTEADRRTDIYAAGIVLWELLTGQRLFHGKSDAATVKLVMEGHVPAASTLNPEVSPPLDAVVLKALAKASDARFATAAELAQALTDAVPPATAAELGAWVRRTAQDDLELKTKLIAAIESRGSAKNKSEAARSLEAATGRASLAQPPGKTQIVADAPTAPTRAAMRRPASHPPPTAMQKTMPLPPEFRPPVVVEEAALPSPTRTVLMPPPVALPAPASTAKVIVIAVAVGALVLIGAVIATVLVMRPPRAPTAAPSASARATPAAPSCPEGMVRVPNGQFFMGSDDDSTSERPAHRVQLGDYCLDRREVTVKQYKACADVGECLRLPRETTAEVPAKQKAVFDAQCNANDESRAEHPANCIGWEQARAFCEHRGARLPTEAEWEYAARGTDGRTFSWGDDAPNAKRMNGCGSECVRWLNAHGEQASLPLYPADDGWPTTAPVGSFPDGASRVGAEDMIGNVAEWVADYYAPYEKGEATQPRGPASGRDRVARGGAWSATSAEWLRTTYRFNFPPTTNSHLLGFRCAKAL